MPPLVVSFFLKKKTTATALFLQVDQGMLNIINHHWNIPFRFGSYLVYLQIWSCDFDQPDDAMPLLEEGLLSSKRVRSRRQQCHCHCWIQLHRHLAQHGCSVKQVKNTKLIKFYQGIWLKNPNHSGKKPPSIPYSNTTQGVILRWNRLPRLKSLSGTPTTGTPMYLGLVRLQLVL